VRVPIQDQPLQVLRLFLEAEGKVVTREQLRAALWPQDTFVDFEHGVNTAVKKLRQALEDSAERPKFVETLPKVGYRFIVPVEWGNDVSKSGMTVLAATPLQLPEIDPSIFRRFFLLFGETPYRRWEIVHARMAVWCVLLGCLGWRFMLSVPHRWGTKLFLLQLACIGFLLLLLGFLLYTGASNFSGLSREVHRMAFWIRWLTVGLVLATWSMAYSVASSHPILAAFLVLCSALGGLKYTLFKTAIDRAAFPNTHSR